MEFLIWLTPALIAIIAYFGHMALSGLQDDLRLLKIKSEANTEELRAIREEVAKTNLRLSMLHDVKVIAQSSLTEVGNVRKSVDMLQKVGADIPVMKKELEFHKENHGKIILILNKIVNLRNK